MKKRLAFALAVAFIVTSSATSIWATSSDDVGDDVVTLEEECQTQALEQQIPDEDLAKFIEDCMTAEFEGDDTGQDQEEDEQPAQE